MYRMILYVLAGVVRKPAKYRMILRPYVIRFTHPDHRQHYLRRSYYPDTSRSLEKSDSHPRPQYGMCDVDDDDADQSKSPEKVTHSAAGFLIFNFLWGKNK